uniref:Uncharacterized protein n=1 Tax=Panagrellus redivivus TaxID=6233 RepID=A0A7E4ZZV5_PANRE
MRIFIFLLAFATTVTLASTRRTHVFQFDPVGSAVYHFEQVLRKSTSLFGNFKVLKFGKTPGVPIIKLDETRIKDLKYVMNNTLTDIMRSSDHFYTTLYNGFERLKFKSSRVIFDEEAAFFTNVDKKLKAYRKREKFANRMRKHLFYMLDHLNDYGVEADLVLGEFVSFVNDMLVNLFRLTRQRQVNMVENSSDNELLYLSHKKWPRIYEEIKELVKP